MLTTPWTSLVSPSNALPEYPRPQLTRLEWLNLNGLWQFAPASSLANPPIGQDLPKSVLVPFPIESELSRIRSSERHIRHMWYRRTVRIPPEWQGRRIQLNFGAVNWQADVWINGRLAGRHRGAYDAFSFDITDALHEGDNEIIVGVHSPLEEAGIPLGKQRRGPHDIFYTGSSGIWQTVWLEPTRAAHITKLEMTPDVPGEKLDLIVRSVGFFAQDVRVVVFAGAAQVADVSGNAGEVIHVPIPNTRLWSPEDPFLYELRVTLSGLGGSDTVGSYFGMRSISMGVVNNVLRPLLNGRFVFQLGLLDQGFWPDGLYTAPTDDALKFDLQQHKILGFNTVRKHIKVEPARWYYWADRLGLLVWQDMPSLPVTLPKDLAPPPMPSPDSRPNFEDELHRIIDQLRSITSIVQWQPFNESWGAYDRDRIAALVKSWDPTRLVDIDSGGWRSIAGGKDRIDDTGSVDDCLDDHVYPGPQGLTFDNGMEGPRPPTDTRVAILGEFGAARWSVDDHQWHPGAGFHIPKCPDFTPPTPVAIPSYSPSDTMTDWYVEKLKEVGNLVTSRGLSAAMYVQLTDVEDEHDGLWTYDRRVLKVDSQRIMWANLTARTAGAKARSQQHVFYRGTSDSAINHIFWDAAMDGLYVDSWTTKTHAPAAAGNPATMLWPKQQHVFYRGTDGAINHIFYDQPTNQLYHDQWTARTNAPPAAGDPATLPFTNPNQQHVFYRGTDGAINHIFYDQPTNQLYRDQWQPNPQVPSAPPAVSNPVTLVTPTQQHVFYRGPDGAINHIFWDAQTNRLHFDQWTSRAQAPLAAGDPSTMFTI